MYDTATRHDALTLYQSGLTFSETSRVTGVSAPTIRSWARTVGLPSRKTHVCPVAGGVLRSGIPAFEYTYLLGLYLGDGYINKAGRIPQLLIYCGDAWPGLVDRCAQAMAAVNPSKEVAHYQAPGCTNVTSRNRHWPCLFPQHGAGRKHTRTIALTPWQQALVRDHPWDLIRGLIHSDGCRYTNWTTREVAGRKKRYTYARYQFTNMSTDIIRILTDTLDAVGVAYTVSVRTTGARDVSVARRASVALMDEHVGAKY